MHKGLIGTKGGKRYFPIPFHSHPRHEGDRMYFIRDFLQLSTSEADKKSASKVLRYDTISITLIIPSALIYVIEDGLFLGFYGDKIAPDDFREYTHACYEYKNRHYCVSCHFPCMSFYFFSSCYFLFVPFLFPFKSLSESTIYATKCASFP